MSTLRYHRTTKQDAVIVDTTYQRSNIKGQQWHTLLAEERDSVNAIVIGHFGDTLGTHSYERYEHIDRVGITKSQKRNEISSSFHISLAEGQSCPIPSARARRTSLELNKVASRSVLSFAISDSMRMIH